MTFCVWLIFAEGVVMAYATAPASSTMSASMMPNSMRSSSSSSMLIGVGMTKFCVLGDLLGELAVLVGLRVLRVVLDDGLAAKLGALDLVLAGDEVDHLGAELGGRAPR